jgi:phosphoglycolate phosphatase
VFDFDGTLVDSREDVWRSIEYAAEAAGARVPPQFRARPRNLSLSRLDIWRRLGGSEERFDEFSRELTTHYLYANDFANTAPYPGVMELLEALANSGREMYIVTNKDFSAADALIRKLGLAPFFRLWYSPDGPGDWNLNKTELIAMLKANELAGKSAVYIGDSSGDAEAAHANGMPVIGALYGDGDPRDGQVPDALADCPLALFNLLGLRSRQTRERLSRERC